MMNLSSPAMRFGGVILYRTQNQKTMSNAIEQKNILPMSIELGQRQLGPTHELVDLTGQDIFKFYEQTMGIQFPDTLKALPPEEAFEKLETSEDLAPLRDKMDQFGDAMSSGGMFDIGSALTMSTAFFQYLGYCQGKGTTADGTPVQVINLDA